MTVQINELVIRAKIGSQLQSERAETVKSDESLSKKEKIAIENSIVVLKNRRER